MPCLLIRHHVADYAAWKAVFDEQELTRRANGSQGEGSSTAPATRTKSSSSSSGTTSTEHACSPTPTICGKRWCEQESPTGQTSGFWWTLTDGPSEKKPCRRVST